VHPERPFTVTIKPPPTHWQPNLLDVVPDKRIEHPGEARTRYGQVVEQIVTGLLGLTDIPNSGSHDIVFDAHHKPSQTFVEIKSLRRGSSLPIYEWRRAKDRDCGVPLVYVVAIHNCTKTETIADIWRKMAGTIGTLLVLPHWLIDLEARQQPLRQLVKEEPNTRMGYKRKGYCDGYRNIPQVNLSKRTFQDPVKVSSTVCGFECSADVMFHPAIEPWLSRP